MARVLLIDDDVELVEMLKEYLEQDGFTVHAAHDGQQGLVAALTGHFDIAVLDVMMPKVDGVDTLRRLRRDSQMPVLMLTAKGDDMDRILGLELGADDYVPKPCTPRELSARLRAILRRARPAQEDSDAPSHLVAGPLEMWPEQRRAQWSGTPVELTSTEFNLLEVLLRNAGKTVSKNELSEKALGRPLARFDRNVDVHMSSLRQKLGVLPDGRSCIQTVHRQGYLLLKA
ncbi:response regulator transcription factor [Noviherbaspirillum galbum]|uniref:Response regulator transcription factor n=1 Tax=Noviherbaspirillum galbum TaxID=2709383 RepID=A0A6B3SMU2_9BURK|nr:response regulator transcription factor [Noviherbaspirillum galbum]NEX60036.1 response regulator transcription factor [Noviherbaspirillum galbum]